MSRSKILLLAIAVVISVTAGGCGYNTLQAKQQKVRAMWAQIENQLQRRSDLINNMIETAKLAGVQEQEVFGTIAQSNSQLLNAQKAAPQGEGGDKTPEQRQAVMDAANSFGGTIGRLLSLQQSWPVLNSNENFLKAQDELVGTENRIATARGDYNTAVQDYNTTRGSFPTVIGAKMYGFKEEPYFKADPGATAAPKINSDDYRRNTK